MSKRWLHWAGAALLLLAGCDRSWKQAAPTRRAPSDDSLEKLASEHLPNLVRLHPRVLSGGLPADDAAFRELADRGVRTIVSVDGMQPDVAAARKHGLQYVHLPHGYDGISSLRAQELAKAVRDLEGPLYIHCHHGKHRSPAAAAVACVGAGLIPAGQALTVLELAGADPGYQGLYAAAREARTYESALLDALKVEFREVQPISPLADAMVQLSHAQEHMQRIAAAGWQTPPSHPDLDPAHEALLMRELFAELLRSEHASNAPEPFREWLRDSETAARKLETAFEKAATRSTAAETALLHDLSNRIGANCKACHRQYRDVPRDTSD